MSLDSSHFPRIIALGDGSLVCVTRCDTEAVVYDRVAALGTTPESYRTTAPAMAALPVAGFNPVPAETWPTDAEIAHAIANPPMFTPTVPTSVTRRQLLLVLNANGVTRTAVRAMLAGNEAALIEFDEASEFRRDHSLVGQLGTALGMNAQQIDSMFITAATL